MGITTRVSALGALTALHLFFPKQILLNTGISDILLRWEKPLSAEYEDLYRRSRWEDDPDPAHLAPPPEPPGPPPSSARQAWHGGDT